MRQLLGIDFDGDKGLMRASQRRLWPSLVITLRVCALGLCTIGLLESLAGIWVALLGVRRRLYSAMELIFELLSIELPKNTVLRLSPDLLGELSSLAILGTLAVVNLRAEFADFVIATDASSSWMAAVIAELSAGINRELSRHCLKKGIWAKLLPPGRALLREPGMPAETDEVPELEEMFRSHPLWDVLARSVPYRECWRQRIRRRRHINVSELDAS